MMEHWSWYLPEDLPVGAEAPRVQARGTWGSLVDLDQPAGFAAVLRWWSITTGTLPDPPLVRRWLLDQTTDLDRLLVARACAELMTQLRGAA